MPVPSTDDSHFIRRSHLLLALLIVALGPVDPAIAATGISSASAEPAVRDLRSAALADALKRRQPRRDALRQDQRSERPPVAAGIPGISTARVLAFRREMFRTDI